LTERSVNERRRSHKPGPAEETFPMAYPFETVRLELADGVATLTLNRPDRLNSFTAAMHHEVRVAIDEAAGDPSVRCFVLTGAGRGFCAGQDLSDRAVAPGEAPVDLGASIENYY
jgi:2-(1,2-epoxy-1,2-dihydrophenyl)acetyl-CoA isomerase